ncbi:MAG: MBOAT family protein [Bacteroidales bacterium]|nr:MBOAT family protein [Bacteroidales bacterium]
MIFNSVQFAIFLPIVFALYWLLRRRLLWQNMLVLAASYVFYGWWDWRFLLLIAFTSGCSYLSGLLIKPTNGGGNLGQAYINKFALWGNIVVNLAILALFKYYDFFASELAQLLHLQSDPLLLHLVLPVGISFYTFQALSYSIDIYKGKLEPTRDVVAFFAYIAFFPQLVAGPIERATNLLPQFLHHRHFNHAQAVDGARQILWGLFKKMVVADNCAVYVDEVFSYGGGPSTHLLAAVLFSFQIYGDFAGYSDIAIGTAKLFGIRLMQNFRTPYFSRDIAEFWRRWHISLTTWFRDYVYIPLGGSRVAKWKVARNTFVIFLISGLWHGANWTFITWGFYHACLFLPLILLNHNRKHTDVVAFGRWLPSLKESGQILLTFALVTIGWIIFRCTGIPSTTAFLTDIFSPNALAATWKFFVVPDFPVARAGIIIMIIVEWIQRDKEHGLQDIDNHIRSKNLRCGLYIISIVLIFFFRGDYATFIYFQF